VVNKGRDFSLFLLFNKGDCLFSGCCGVKIGACALLFGNGCDEIVWIGFVVGCAVGLRGHLCAGLW